MPISLNSKTYNFIGFDRNGVSIYQETSAGVPTGFSYLTCRVFPATDKSPAKVRWRLTMPIVATDDSSCTCSGAVLRSYTYDEGRVEIPGTGSSAERTDFSVRLKDMTASAQYIASVVSLVQPSS